jgi:hypothetical protein
MSGNLAASVRARLTNLARDRKEDIGLVFTRYGLERLLYRLSQSPYNDRFLLKGALLFTLWYDVPHRPTGTSICSASARTIFLSWRQFFARLSSLITRMASHSIRNRYAVARFGKKPAIVVFVFCLRHGCRRRAYRCKRTPVLAMLSARARTGCLPDATRYACTVAACLPPGDGDRREAASDGHARRNEYAHEGFFRSLGDGEAFGLRSEVAF